ncbi:hypothetical protein ACFZA2_12050 [Microbacterium sp. NPDC007973]|uniref:hypothetical protein n=1 Tax=Microbacterium sp. NPDC007973 TaxID=3364182 RepID=UPI0036E35490
MRRTFTRGVLALALATCFAVGGSAGAGAASASADTSASAAAIVTTPRSTIDGSDIAPSPTAHALRSTGLDASTLLSFWVGGGALALASAAVLVTVKVRQARKETAAANTSSGIGAPPPRG